MAPNTDTFEIYKDKDFIYRYRFAEKVTELFAQPLIDQSSVAASQQPIIFDNACGTGIVSSVLHRTLTCQVGCSYQLTCGDLSEGMVEYARQRALEEGWQNTQSKVVNAQETRLPTQHYTHIYTAFAFTKFPDPTAAMKECFRSLQSGGTIALSTWQRTDWFLIMESAVKTLPENLAFPNMEEFLALFNKDWDSEAYIRSQLEQEGFRDIEVTTVTKQISLPIKEIVELNKSLIPAILGRLWAQSQRDQHESGLPMAIQRYLEGNYGSSGLVPIVPTAIIATARKP